VHDSPGPTVREALPGEHEDVDRVVRAAFGAEDPAEGELVGRLTGALRRAGHVRASLVAEVEGRLVGHVQLNRSWVDAPERLVEVVVLSPLSVVPDAQRRGVGTTLVEAAIAEATRIGAPAVFLEGSPDWYAARGFTPGGDHGFERPSDRIPAEAFQVVLLDADDGSRGRLVYCDPLWSLDCVGLR